jgi:hypothetical protein
MRRRMIRVRGKVEPELPVPVRDRCLDVYIRERYNCASCPWMDVPRSASLAMFKEAVLISALVRRSRLGYPQGSHFAMIAAYACTMWRRDTSFGTRPEAALRLY